MQSLPQLRRSGWTAAALGVQRGAVHSRHSIEPVVGFGMGQDEHFMACLEMARTRADPWSAGVAADADYRFAAEQLVTHRHDLRAHRKRVRGALRELSKRCKPLDSALRARQGPEVQRAAGRTCLGLLNIPVI